MNVLDALRCLNLELLDDAWVNEALDFQVIHLPESYNEFLQDVDIGEILSECSAALTEWLSQPSGINEASTNWSVLLQHNLKRKALVALIGFMLTTSPNLSPEESSMSSLLWSEFYFLLLAIPGSSACKVFDAIVYSKALASFEIVKLALGNNKKSCKSKKNRLQYDGSNTDERESSTTIVLTHEVKAKIVNGVNSLFRSFSRMLNNFSLRVNEMSLINTVETLCNLTRVEGETSRYPRNFESQTCLQMVSCNSFLCLQCICSQLHGNMQEIFKLVTKYLLPNILLKGAYGFEASFLELKNICSKAVHFLQFMIAALGEPAYDGIFLLVKHTCLKTVEKADYRHQGSVSVVLLLRSLPAKPHKELVRWLFVFSLQDKASYRLFGLEVISKLLFDKERLDEQACMSPALSSVPEQQAVENDCNESSEDPALSVLTSQERHNMLDKYFLAIIFGRCNDASSAVRAKALSVIADCMTLEYPDARDIMSAIFVRPYENVVSAYEADLEENGFMDHAYLIQCFDRNMNMDPLPGATAVILLIKRIVLNTKVHVTKSALKVLENIMLMSEKWMSENILEVMCQFCRSSSVIIRKNMIDSLTKLLLKYPHNNLLAKLWVKKVLMQVDDQESTVKDKSVQAAYSALITNILPAKAPRNAVNMLPWVLLKHVVDLNMRWKLISVCSLWLQDNRTQTQPYNLLLALQTHLNTEHRIAAWTMIRCLSSDSLSSNTVKVPNPDFLYESYMMEVTDLHKPDSELVLSTILEILHAWWKVMPEELWTDLLNDMMTRLETLAIPYGLISPMMETALTVMENSSEDGRDLSRAFAAKLIEMCDNYLKTIMVDFLFWKTSNGLETCLRHVMTLGSAILICPHCLKKDTFRMLLQLTFPHSSKLPGAAELLQAQQQLGKVQIAGMITLARYGLVNDTYVKQIARSLADLLTSSKMAEVKHNTILILTDLCGRYTSVVEPLLPSLYLCLKDSDSRIRRTMLISFIELLNTEYLKPKGALFLYLLTMLCDPDEEVKMYIKSYITKCLILKNKTVMASNFPESLFFYNDYRTHSTYGRFHTSVENKYFKMSGPQNKQKRHLVYRFMLKHMTDDQRFTTAQKLCSDILDAVGESISLDGPGLFVVQDTLFALLTDEIRLNRQRSQLEDDDPADETEAVAATEIAALRNTISEVHKRNAIETILPVLKHLKEKLEKCLSPLVQDVNLCLRNIMLDYRKEVEEYFTANNDFITLGQITELVNQLKKPQRKRAENVGADDVEEEPVLRNTTQAVTHSRARVSRRSSRIQEEISVSSSVQQGGEVSSEESTVQRRQDIVSSVLNRQELVGGTPLRKTRSSQGIQRLVNASEEGAECRAEMEEG